jgi:hypothetical protein
MEVAMRDNVDGMMRHIPGGGCETHVVMKEFPDVNGTVRVEASICGRSSGDGWGDRHDMETRPLWVSSNSAGFSTKFCQIWGEKRRVKRERGRKRGTFLACSWRCLDAPSRPMDPLA